MEHIGSYMPPHEGLLPKWLFLVSVVAFANSIQAYSTLRFTQRVYSGVAPLTHTVSSKASPGSAPVPSSSPVTPLSARTFGTWTFISTVVRLYAAYNIESKVAYELALWTYAAAFGHFMSEWLIYKTAKWGAGLAGPVFVSTGSLVWMLTQWNSYVKY